MTQLKRKIRIEDKGIDEEFESVLNQVPHKDDVQDKLEIIDETITIQSINDFKDKALKFNRSDGKIYFRASDKLYSISATEIT